MKRLLMICLAACFALLASCRHDTAFYERERMIIDRSDSLMYVTTIQADSCVLRTPSRDLSEKELRSPRLRSLCAKMLYTVRHPSQDGVGIAAPQVGLDLRLIWVQRFDKEGEPFECYANVHLDSLGGEITHGPEGCLSVPPMRGLVPRYSHVDMSYTDPFTLEIRHEAVDGYTAIIFQHECDHLDGCLYIDRADTVFVSENWVAEREQFDYSRPEWF